MIFKAATFNIQCGRNHAKRVQGENPDIELDRVVEHIKKMDADFCSINEITDALQGTEFGQQPAYLAQELGWNYAFGKAIDVKRKDAPVRGYGIAVLSKHPIRSFRRIPIQTTPEERQEGCRYEDRMLMIVELEINGKIVTVMNCHFGLNEIEVDKATDAVMAAKAEITGPVVLTGDFNITPDDAHILRIKEVFADTADIKEDACLTFPSHEPRIKIDYILTDKDTKTLDLQIPTEVVADHLPMIATLEVK